MVGFIRYLAVHQLVSRISNSKCQFDQSEVTYLPNLYYKVRCVCQHLNVLTLTSPSVLKLWGTQGYLCLSYDLTEVIKLIGVTFEEKNNFFFEKILYVIPSALLSFLPHCCHSFHITVIPSGLLSFLPY